MGIQLTISAMPCELSFVVSSLSLVMATISNKQHRCHVRIDNNATFNFDALLAQTTGPLIYVLHQRKSSVAVRWHPSFGCRPLGEERTNAHSGSSSVAQRLRTTVARSWYKKKLGCLTLVHCPMSPLNSLDFDD